MSLSQYLRSIPKDNLPAACNAAGESIYQQHMDVLRNAAQLKTKTDVDRAIAELESLIKDSNDLLNLNVLTGHTFNKIQKVSELNISSVLASLRFSMRHPSPN